MEIGIDSFAKKTQTNDGGTVDDDAKAMSELIERIVHADKVGLDVFGLGEHHREEFLDSAAHNILAAAIIGSISHISHYFIHTIFFDLKESLALRLIAAILCFSVIFYNKFTIKFKKNYLLIKYENLLSN